MDHQQSDGPPSLHTPQHLIEGSSQQPSQEDPFPRPSYDPPDGAVRGRGLTGRGLPSLCYACFEQLPPEELVLGYCYHNYCQECVVVMVKAANEIDNLYPVRCCEIMIPLDWDTLQMPQQAVDKYNRRKREIEARGTTYCYRRACRAPIHPKFILHGVAAWQTCDCIQPDRNAVTDELGRAVQAQVDGGGLDSILHNLRRRVGRPMLVKYENYMTERMERHLAEAERIHLGIRAITTSGGLRPEPCKHERWVLHQITYVPCDICGIMPTGFTQSCMYCLIQACQNCRAGVDQTRERD
ncbi:hypothetical protein ACSS6W_009800 [Trichoderma asperelloides]